MLSKCKCFFPTCFPRPLGAGSLSCLCRSVTDQYVFCCKVTISENTGTEKLSQVMATDMLDKAQIKQYGTESQNYKWQNSQGPSSSSGPGMKACGRHFAIPCPSPTTVTMTTIVNQLQSFPNEPRSGLGAGDSPALQAAIRNQLEEHYT